MELKATRYALDEDGVATVWLHRPQRHNAWTGRMHAEYRHIFATLADDHAVRAVVVTGTPPAFSVGGDSDALAGHSERGGYDSGLPTTIANPGYGVQPEFDNDFAWQFGLPFPVIAAVNGACAGVALALACFCDLRFGAVGAKLTTAAPRIGLPAEYGLSWILPRLVGVTHAADLLFSGRAVPAEDAPPGLFNAIHPADGVVAAALDYAHTLAATTGPNAVAATKAQLYRDLVHHDVGASIETSKRLIDEHVRSAEYAEGVAALRAKRPPRFDARD
jgi:enoyl-CoA hydratase/carnithine racemase